MNVLDYLGKEWIQGEYDCWAFVRDIYLKELGIDLPMVCINTEDARSVLSEFSTSDIYSQFEVVSIPEEYDIVLMGANRPRHCGIYLNLNGSERVIHNHRGFGVVCDTISHIKSFTNILSFNRFRNG